MIFMLLLLHKPYKAVGTFKVFPLYEQSCLVWEMMHWVFEEMNFNKDPHKRGNHFSANSQKILKILHYMFAYLHTVKGGHLY